MASKASNGLVYILLALLILGLGGFGATSFTGSVSSVAKVEGKPVRIDSYSRELQNQMNQIGQSQMGRPLTLAEAEGFGIPQGVLAQLVSDRALDAEAARLGLSVGDETLSQQIMQIPAFQGPNGTFSRDSYSFALQQAGLSEKDFESDLRDETARSVLQAAVIAATRMPESYAGALVNYIAETRDITLLRLDQDNLPEPLAEPSEEELRAFYEENIAEFTAPEKKRITYAVLAPDSLVDDMPIDPERVREVYESRIDEFEQPERRLVERLAFASEEAAEAAKTALDAGETDFETLVQDRGLTLTDVDRGDVSQAALGAAGEAVFAAESGDVVGPLPSDLGPALFRVNGVLAANNTDYGTASLMIREELAADAARREVARQAEPAEDLLAGGATLAELAEETGMELGTIDWFDGLSEGIAGYADFDDAAAAVAEGDYPEIAELDDGGIFALRLDEVVPPAPEPFEEVRDRVFNNWEAQQTDAALTARAEAITARIEAGESLEAIAEAEGLELRTETGITRGGNVLGTATGYNASVFGMEEGATMISSAFGAVILTRLDAVTPPAEGDEQTAQLRQQITGQVSSGLAQDLYAAYADEVQGSMDVRIDQEALNAIHSQFR
ncbi:MAG: peptidylprolyl isomerase [Rhodobacteraceae bacterium]|nr:peptidylprolyl isomerase [Paracoccaceae bacterium]MBR9821670.1 peptidylprolyl isomerase [Paracoccaceae bacterium]